MPRPRSRSYKSKGSEQLAGKSKPPQHPIRRPVAVPRVHMQVGEGMLGVWLIGRVVEA
jgi:hypothetical protein